MVEKTTEKLIVGAALAFAASTLWPMVRDTLKPLAATGAGAAEGLTDKVRYAVKATRDEIEDIVAEAQFERMKKKLDREIAAPETVLFEEDGEKPHAERYD